MAWVAVGVAGAGAILKGVNMYNAGVEKDRANAELDRINKQPLPKYTANPALMSFYSKALNDVKNPQGFSAAERANFQSGMGRTMNTQFNNALTASGGNSARYIRNALTGSGLMAQNQFAAQDASLARQQQGMAYSRLGQATNQLQNLDNMNTQVGLNRRLMTEQALGGAVAQNKAFIANSMEGIGSDLMGMGAYGLMSGGMKFGAKPRPTYGSFKQGVGGYYDPQYNPNEPMTA